MDSSKYWVTSKALSRWLRLTLVEIEGKLLVFVCHFVTAASYSSSEWEWPVALALGFTTVELTSSGFRPMACSTLVYPFRFAICAAVSPSWTPIHGEQ
jgi:hypothetical protein